MNNADCYLRVLRRRKGDYKKRSAKCCRAISTTSALIDYG